jgi:hypothetical protein
VILSADPISPSPYFPLRSSALGKHEGTKLNEHGGAIFQFFIRFFFKQAIFKLSLA